jgi:hypothetical protein
MIKNPSQNPKFNRTKREKRGKEKEKEQNKNKNKTKRKKKKKELFRRRQGYSNSF